MRRLPASERPVVTPRQAEFRREILVFVCRGIWYDVERRTRITNDRNDCVFISSTFRDRHAGRGYVIGFSSEAP